MSLLGTWLSPSTLDDMGDTHGDTKLSSATHPNPTSTCHVSTPLNPGAGQCTTPGGLTQSPGLLSCTVGMRRSVHKVVWVSGCWGVKWPPVPDHRQHSAHTQEVHPTPGCKAAFGLFSCFYQEITTEP